MELRLKFVIITKNNTELQIRSKSVRFEAFTAVTMKKAVFRDLAPCICGVNRRFGGTYRLHLQGRRKI
jgi:thermostable 8-oxoguanine DNA glycosylase